MRKRGENCFERTRNTNQANAKYSPQDKISTLCDYIKIIKQLDSNLLICTGTGDPWGGAAGRVDDPPFVILDQILSVFDDRVEIVLVRVHLTDRSLCSEPCVLEEGQKLDFLFRQIGMPKINDEDDPCLVSFMPGLVFETIIKNIGLSFLLNLGLISHPHATILDSCKGQMKSQFFISGAVMFHDVGVGGDGANEGVVVVIWNIFVDHLHNKGHLFAIVVKFHVVKLKVKNVPSSTVD